MSKNIHDMDESFRSAYQQYEDNPSPAVWEKINANLDRKEADSYKRRLFGWKLMTIVLLLLLTGLIIYESGIFRTNSKHHQENSILTNDKNRNNSIPSLQEPSSNSNRPITIDQKSNDPAEPGHNNLLQQEKDKQSDVAVQNNAWHRKPSVAENEQQEITILPSNPEKKAMPGLENDDTPLQQKFLSIPLLIKNISSKINSSLAWDFEKSWPLLNNDPLLKNIATSTITPEKKKNSFHPFWLITGFAAYEQANYKLDSDKPNAITNIRHYEQHEPSYSGGILLSRQLTKKWGVQTGLIYSNTNIGISKQKLYALQDPGGNIAFKYVTSSGYAYIKRDGTAPAIGDSITANEAKHTLQSISIPVAIKYTIGKKKFSITPGAGIEANFITSAIVEVELEDTPAREVVSINKLKGTRSFYWTATADADLRYKINKKLSITVRPSFKYALSPITKNTEVETFPYSFGLGAGLTYKF